jgi:chromosome segregation ATPase
MQDIDKDPSEFKINLDDNPPDSPLQEGMEDLRIEKLNHRVTLFSILIPGLIGIILFFAYVDIKKRVISLHDTGTDKVQSLSKEMEDRLSSLIVQYAKLESSIKKDFSSLRETTSSLEKNLKKTTTAINTISASKADKNELKQTLASIGTDLKNDRHKIKTVEDKLGKETAKLTQHNDKFGKATAKLTQHLDKVQNDLKRIQADISDLSSSRMEKKDIDLGFENQKKDYQKQIEELRSNFQYITNDLKKKIRGLEKRLQIQESRPIAVPHQMGDIMEQDIAE